MINYVNLRDLIKLVNNEEISEKYVNYLCGFDEKHQYRHNEIEAVYDLIDSDDVKDILFNNFLYGYSIPYLNKEFDLKEASSLGDIIKVSTLSKEVKRLKEKITFLLAESNFI